MKLYLQQPTTREIYNDVVSILSVLGSTSWVTKWRPTNTFYPARKQIINNTYYDNIIIVIIVNYYFC